jgi:hypothetical protein
MLLYYVHLISSSEIVLRLPSILAGGLFCWGVYKWLKLISGETAAVVGLALAAFTPSVVLLGAEVRQYSMLLFFMVAGLYFLERGLLTWSARALLVSALFEVLAVLTHYSALLFVVVTGLYGFSRVVELRKTPVLMASWIAGQAIIGATVVGLYFSHIRQLAAAGAPQAIASTYLESTLFDSSKANFVTFGARATFRLFHYLFSQPVVAAVVLLLFAVGLAILWRQPSKVGAAQPRRLMLFLLAGPLVNYAAALARAYPYGGTRHSVWLFVFVLAGASIGLSGLKIRSDTKAVIAAVLMLVCYLAPHPLGAFIRFSNQRRSLMNAAVRNLQQTAQPGSVFLLDNQSNYAFRYYFCRDKVIDFQIPAPGFVDFSCGAYRGTVPTANSWMFTPDTLSPAVEHARTAFGVPPGQKIWFYQSGWAVDTEPGLRAAMRRMGCSDPRQFGANIVVCQLGPGESF